MNKTKLDFKIINIGYFLNLVRDSENLHIYNKKTLSKRNRNLH